MKVPNGAVQKSCKKGDFCNDFIDELNKKRKWPLDLCNEKHYLSADCFHLHNRSMINKRTFLLLI